MLVNEAEAWPLHPFEVCCWLRWRGDDPTKITQCGGKALSSLTRACVAAWNWSVGHVYEKMLPRKEMTPS